MPQSLSNILLHIVFSTKDRTGFILPEIETELYPYVATICKSFECPALAVGGTENHIHVLCRLSRTITVSKLVEKIKTGSSKWIKNKGSRYHSFSWQRGYGAFSIGVSNLDALKQYIANQKEHHRHRKFEDELRAIFKKYKIGYDERYVWD
ncbi:transposase [Desulfonema ishimotonii]|uniref:Transposase n=1 Tax=Desulfonema ishimotonii TaxID=45657 RepID=A0A401FY81_9BACT|nr:IS200/IS605 family transposase [Desulfonema ishimotonii]GBC61962.1 transposase [Desulfonema ishimotonii]